MFFFKSSNLDLCLPLMCHHKLLLILLSSPSISFAHNLALDSFLFFNKVFLYGTSVISIVRHDFQQPFRAGIKK